jgi:class 3 adenylate cyclase/tetratricopeptide (TPR) repeat protein
VGGSQAAPSADRRQLELAIAAQEALRGTVPDDVVDVAVDALRRQLAALDAGTQRRRQVTVLFADVSGFTAMSERMDAELVAELINRIWSRLDVVVADHGGVIDKHIGDALMAVWGAATAEEHDPERAVHAGLAMQHALGTFAADAGIGVAMRIGISTGPALIGAVGTTSELTVLGDTVNVASRLEHLAPEGAVLISHDTYRTVRGVFDVRPRGELTVRGRTAPVRAYIVDRAKPLALRVPTREVEGVETRTIGRDDELAVLRSAYRELVDESRGRLVTVIAEAGTGKSRLLYEFLNWVELEPSVSYLYTGRATADRERVALGLFRDVVATRFGIHDSDPPSTVAMKLRDGFADQLARAEADVVGRWLGFELSSIPDADHHLLGGELAGTARTHVIEYFDALTTRHPVVLALEDIHWADDESLDLILDLVAEPRRRLLVLGLARPALLDRRPDWPPQTATATRLDLGPLSEMSTRALVREVLQRVDHLPDRLVERIVSRADGNAFYIEELVKMLIDEGAIDTSSVDDVWRVDDDRVDPLAVPSTLTGVLQARLDVLAVDEQRTLQCASVVGRIFWDAAVTALGRDSAGTEQALEATSRRELVFRRARSSFHGTAEYIFKHALLRDVAYETVLLRERQALHARAGAWLEAVAGERVAEYRETIAGHYQAAGMPAEAADQLAQVGLADLMSGTPVAARRSLDAAVELWATAGRDPPAETLVSLAEACLLLDDVDAAEEALTFAARLPSSASSRAEILLHRSWAAAARGEPSLQRSLLDEALPLATASDEKILRKVLGGLAWSDTERGAFSQAAAHAKRGLEIAERLGDPGELGRALADAALVAGERDDLQTSQRLIERQAAVAEASGNLVAQALAYTYLGIVIHLRGDVERDPALYLAAATQYERALALHRRLGQRTNEITDMVNLAQAYLRLGHDGDADVLLREALTAAVAVGLPPIQLLCILVEADLLLERGETDVGLAYLGMCQAHSSTGAIDRREIERILARMSLTPEQIESGLARGRDLDLDTVVHELLIDSR